MSIVKIEVKICDDVVGTKYNPWSTRAVYYKTILVHLNDERRAARLLTCAVGLARAHGAELLGLHVVPGAAALTAVVVPYGAEIASGVVESDRRTGKAIEAMFSEATRAQGIVAQWLEIETMHPDLCAVVLERARSVDLVVAAQADRGWPVSDLMDFPERLALESGRPVLVLPNQGPLDTVGTRAMVAWSGTREAARAAFDALPMLAMAQSVHVVTAAGADIGYELPVRAADLVGALARHGITATGEEMVANEAEVSELLLACAANLGVDLLVMGAYGHSRWREYIFGGVTRAVARRMTVPTLLSH